MSLVFLPQPQRVRRGNGVFVIPTRGGRIGIGDRRFHGVAERAREFFPRYAIGIAAEGLATDPVVIRANDDLPPDGYRLRIASCGVTIEARDATGADYALHTLRQVAQQSPRGRLAAVTIDDHPDFAQRSIYYDVCRGRVPTRAALLEQASGLARYKINELQYYVKHTFQWRGHPLIWRGCGPLTPEDVLALDTHCDAHHIELVPSLSSFGHMERILDHAPYRHLAEDLCEHRYVSDAPPHETLPKGWTIAPGRKESYAFLDSLWSEFLPLFRSRRFNVCCDETYDLGWGQSHAACRRKGKGRVYLDHIKRLRTLARRYDKRILFWGDIIRHYPELIDEIPKDVTALDWNYDPEHAFETIRDFAEAGLDFYACSGTWGWASLFPPLNKARRNIAGFADAARRYGALGHMTTDWGDGGHGNFMEYSWFGYLFGAEQSWNARADKKTFTKRWCRLFLGIDDARLVEAVETLGEWADHAWRRVFYEAPDAPIVTGGGPLARYDHRLRRHTVRFDAAYGREATEHLKSVRKTLARWAGQRGTDPMGVLPYWVFAADTMIHAARKLAAFGAGGRATDATCRALRAELPRLQGRFERLWLARNRPSELRITQALYAHARQTLQ